MRSFGKPMRVSAAVLFTTLLTIVSAPAEAAWHVAKSKHFIIYADERPATLQSFAERLEKFDRAVRRIYSFDDPPVGDGNRLTVFVVSGADEVSRLFGDKTGFTAGRYEGRASGSIAIVPRKTDEWSSLKRETVLLHEYAHHLMMQNAQISYPEWFVEGFAELLATAQFESDGSVRLGLAPEHRADGLWNNPLPLERLLAGDLGKITVAQREAVYGRGWLLTHYLTFEPTRQGQLQAYMQALGRGVDAIPAATSTFGDLAKLNRELGVYLRRKRISSLVVASQALAIEPVRVAALSPGGAAVMPLRIQSKRGVNKDTAEALAAQVRAVAGRYPADPLVQVTLAEAEFDAGHYAASEAAADRAIAADPSNTEAMIYKGRALVERALEADERTRDARLAEARKWFIAANKIDTEDPEPLMEFYLSFVNAGERPTKNAIEALHYASDLAPQDLGLRLNSAVAFLDDGKLPEARLRLAALASYPHGGSIVEAARAAIARVEAGDADGALRALTSSGEASDSTAEAEPR